MLCGFYNKIFLNDDVVMLVQKGIHTFLNKLQTACQYGPIFIQIHMHKKETQQIMDDVFLLLHFCNF